jgi:hypothetical protein
VDYYTPNPFFLFFLEAVIIIYIIWEKNKITKKDFPWVHDYMYASTQWMGGWPPCMMMNHCWAWVKMVGFLLMMRGLFLSPTWDDDDKYATRAHHHSSRIVVPMSTCWHLFISRSDGFSSFINCVCVFFFFFF